MRRPVFHSFSTRNDPKPTCRLDHPTEAQHTNETNDTSLAPQTRRHPGCITSTIRGSLPDFPNGAQDTRDGFDRSSTAVSISSMTLGVGLHDLVNINPTCVATQLVYRNCRPHVVVPTGVSQEYQVLREANQTMIHFASRSCGAKAPPIPLEQSKKAKSSQTAKHSENMYIPRMMYRVLSITELVIRMSYAPILYKSNLNPSLEACNPSSLSSS